MIPALEAGFFRREIADAAFAYQREVDAKRKLIVGVNAFQEAGREAARDAGDRRHAWRRSRWRRLRERQGEARQRGGAALPGRRCGAWRRRRRT